MKWCDRSLIISPVYYGLCKSEAEFQRELKRLDIPRGEWPEFVLDGYGGTTHVIESDDVTCIVCIECRVKGITKTQVHSLITHEAVHVWQEVRDAMGEIFPSSEMEAYSIQMITQNLITAYES